MRDFFVGIFRHALLSATLRHSGAGLPRRWTPALLLLALVSIPSEFLFESLSAPLDTSLSLFLFGKAISLFFLAFAGPALRLGPPALLISIWLVSSILPTLAGALLLSLGIPVPEILISIWILAAAVRALLMDKPQPPAEPDR